MPSGSSKRVNILPKGQEICEIETTKIVNVLEAPFEGTLRKILAKNGDTLIVGGFIAVCAEPQVADAEIDAFVQSLGGTPVAVGAYQKAKQKQSKPLRKKLRQFRLKPQRKLYLCKIALQKPQNLLFKAAMRFLQRCKAIKLSEDVFATPHALKLAEKHNVRFGKNCWIWT